MTPQDIIVKCLKIAEALDTEHDMEKILAKLGITRQDYIQYLQPTLSRVFTGGPVVPYHLITHISGKDFKDHKAMPAYTFATFFPLRDGFHIVLFECKNESEIQSISSIKGMSVLSIIKSVNSNKAMDEYIKITDKYKIMCDGKK